MKALLLLLSALPALAQTESVKFHYGDDLRWADPEFDDSNWIDGNTPVETYAHLLETWQWARYRIRVPQRFLDLSIATAIPTLEVFVEGQRIGGSGGLPPNLRDAPLALHSWAIPSGLAQRGRLLTVALRIWRYPGYDLRRLTFNSVAPPLTLFNAVETPLYEIRQRTLARGRTWQLAMSILLILFLFLSGPAQWTKTEVQLLDAYLLINLISAAVFLQGAYFDFGNRSFAVITFLFPCAYSLQLELVARFSGIRPAWWLRSVQGLNFLVYLPLGWAVLLLDAPSWLPVVGPAWMWILVLNAVAAFAVAIFQRAEGAMSRLLPWGLVVFFLFAIGINTPVAVGDVTFNSNALGNILFGAVLVTVHLYRLRQSSVVALRLQGQFAAARGVQEMLLSGNRHVSTHYAIDPVYCPAGEVGGDFFRILPAPHDATLVVVGDVSGKGLRAAMLVSVIVGVLLHRRSNDPAALLAELNSALAGQLEGGFVTCCCARFDADSKVTLANAGHPAPYCDGGEVEVEAGLPLGIEAAVEYAESVMSAGNFAFVSDGVVEAANAKGELFGFDRTRALSMQPAQTIADAARAWGQNDDITVVTVRRLA